MTLLYLDDRFELHDTGTHPESAKRLMAIAAELAKQGMVPSSDRPTWVTASREQLLRVHSENYIDSVEAFADQGGGRIEQDTIVSPESYRVATLAAGAATDAVRRVLAGEAKTAFCAIRPPGHHALASQAMGFCLLNHVAIAARAACQEYGVDRVLIVDWDVHHGNGTQAIFWEDPRVGFFSIHRWPFYPGTGGASETGSGQGLGTTLNVPVEYGTPVKEYHERFTQALHTIASRVRPELILISAGFDAHRKDPLGSLDLEDHDFAILTQQVIDVANEYAEGRIVSLLEGGYHPAALARSVAMHIQTLGAS